MVDNSIKTYELLYNTDDRFRSLMVQVEQAQEVKNHEKVNMLASSIYLEYNIDITERVQ
tara:strand:- start:466 stop:642 length:177 start_codon:yes stop_codon:yes gene_type:complete